MFTWTCNSGSAADELARHSTGSESGSGSVSGAGEVPPLSPSLSPDLSSMSSEGCLVAFDLDGDGALNRAEFGALCRALFRDAAGAPYALDFAQVGRVFGLFDVDGDGRLNAEEFGRCWGKWIEKILHPVAALLVIDVQNDFISGSLAVSRCPAGQDGAEVVEPINRMLDGGVGVSAPTPFSTVVYSLDWHPANHVSFARNVHLRRLDGSSPIQDPTAAREYDTVVFEPPPVVRSQVLWPAHCEQGSWGAELHSGLRVAPPPKAVFIRKGTNPDIDSYSAFWDNAKLSETSLRAELEARRVMDVFVCGLAYDFCVGATALHALEHGYRTVIVDDACRGMRVEDIQATRDKVQAGGGLIVDSDRVKDMVMGKDRRPELGFSLAQTLLARA